MARYSEDDDRNQGGRYRREQREYERGGSEQQYGRRERPGESEGRWADEYGQGEADFDYRSRHSRQEPRSGGRGYDQGDYGSRRYGAGSSDRGNYGERGRQGDAS